MNPVIYNRVLGNPYFLKQTRIKPFKLNPPQIQTLNLSLHSVPFSTCVTDTSPHTYECTVAMETEDDYLRLL